MKQLGLNQL